MLSRALTLATVMLLIGCLAADKAQAQVTNLEAGKSPSQIFAGTCNACHKSPRGLLKTVPAGSLPTFLRQHYTTSPEMAGVLASFLVSNGATDTRYTGGQPKGTKDGAREAKQEARPNGTPDQLDRFGRRQRPAPSAERQAAKPEAEGLPPQADPGRPGHSKRLARPGEAPDGARPSAEGQVPVQAESDRDPDGRKLSAKQRLSKRSKPGAEEPPKAEEPPGEPPKSETASKDEGKPSTDAKPESAKSENATVEPAKGSPEPLATRPDPVPPVTPAPPPSTTAAVTGRPEPMAAPSEPASQPPPPTVTASTPPPPSVTPAGPPAPPISQ
ncbi:hypothetical protein [Bradyrhizobium sp.]|uniref:hypothetical protein n=1 Tax=Bradyrhizobium sp. TaxID=376 RepID=UPI003BB0A101